MTRSEAARGSTGANREFYEIGVHHSTVRKIPLYSPPWHERRGSSNDEFAWQRHGLLMRSFIGKLSLPKPDSFKVNYPSH